jgi:hypothetical protein
LFSQFSNGQPQEESFSKEKRKGNDSNSVGIYKRLVQISSIYSQSERDFEEAIKNQMSMA